MSPALGMHPGMPPHLQQLQAHLLRSAAAAAAGLLPHAPTTAPPSSQSHPLQQQQTSSGGPESHVLAHGVHPHTHSHAHVHAHGLYPVSPHSAVTHLAHPAALPTKTEVFCL